MITQTDDAELLADGELLRETNEAIAAMGKLDDLVRRMDEQLHHRLAAIERRIFAATACTAAGRALQAELDDGEPRGLSIDPKIVAAVAAARARVDARRATVG